jgi:hypothetical protein
MQVNITTKSKTDAILSVIPSLGFMEGATGTGSRTTSGVRLDDRGAYHTRCR